jgi:hypothetical protein
MEEEGSDELLRVWKERTGSWFHILHQNSLAGSEENYKALRMARQPRKGKPPPQTEYK